MWINGFDGINGIVTWDLVDNIDKNVGFNDMVPEKHVRMSDGKIDGLLNAIESDVMEFSQFSWDISEICQIQQP